MIAAEEVVGPEDYEPDHEGIAEARAWRRNAYRVEAEEWGGLDR